MSHRTVIINVVSPGGAAATIAGEDAPPYRVSVEYRPSDDKTAAQIGNEVERITKKCEQIVAGTGQ